MLLSAGVGVRSPAVLPSVHALSTEENTGCCTLCHIAPDIDHLGTGILRVHPGLSACAAGADTCVPCLACTAGRYSSTATAPRPHPMQHRQGEYPASSQSTHQPFKAIKGRHTGPGSIAAEHSSIPAATEGSAHDIRRGSMTASNVI